MPTQNDGVYSVAASAVAGTSTAVIEIRDGKLRGNDTAGARYEGSVSARANGGVQIDVSVHQPPNTFGIWGTSLSEGIMTRQESHEFPADILAGGKPYVMPSYDMILIFRRIPDEFAGLAGPDGLEHMIGILRNAQKAWAAT